MKKTLVFLNTLFLLLYSFNAWCLSFPLPDQNFISAKMPMHLVYPRPDSETQSHARHRWAHPDMPYEIPIGVQGGAWPFKYELVDSPNGATIGNYYGDDNYGVLSWSPSSSGTYTFRVRITDQELNTVQAVWRVKVDAEPFVFIEDGHTGAKVGTIDRPLEDVNDWFKGDNQDNSYHNKIIVFRSGNYRLVGDASQTHDEDRGHLVLYPNSKTHQIIGWPREWPVINASGAKIISGYGATHDMFVADIRWENARSNVDNSHFFRAWSDVSRSTWWRNQFHNIGAGRKGNDNASPVFISGRGTHKHNILFKHNQLTSINTGFANGSYVDIYYSSHVLIEENVAKNSRAGWGFWAKGTTSFVTMRANEAIEDVSGSQLVFGYGVESPEVPHDSEMCWNNVRVPKGNTKIVDWATAPSYAGKTYNSYIYRNSFINGYVWIRYRGKEDYQVDANVVVSDRLSVGNEVFWDTKIMQTTIPNLIRGESAGLTNQSGKLIGNYRENNLGRVGHEVSDIIGRVKTPKSPTTVIID